MILPIVAYGNPILKMKCDEISKGYKDLKSLIQDMWDTMYSANGIGLAAPQIGKAIRLFIVDTSPFADDKELNSKERDKLMNFKKVFINPEILWSSSKLFSFNEGCLSIPEIRASIPRAESILISYYDEFGECKKNKFDSMLCRVILHEIDHLKGKFFTDYLSPAKRKLVHSKLLEISEDGIPSTGIIL